MPGSSFLKVAEYNVERPVSLEEELCHSCRGKSVMKGCTGKSRASRGERQPERTRATVLLVSLGNAMRLSLGLVSLNNPSQPWGLPGLWMT